MVDVTPVADIRTLGRELPRRKVTQQDIARMTGVSQATVSLVLSGRDDPKVRIAAETRRRVLQAITKTGYVGTPRIPRQAAAGDRVLGVITGEPTFPIRTDAAHHQVLVGIGACAEQYGDDVLLLAGVKALVARRPAPGETNRMRLADGCILVGRSVAPDALMALMAPTQPLVAVGRRDDADHELSYAAADYAGATSMMVARAVALDHRRLAYLGAGDGDESLADRMLGFDRGVREAGAHGWRVTTAGRRPAEVLADLRAGRVTAVLAERYADAGALADAADAVGPAIPQDLSIMVLGDPPGPASSPGRREFTRFGVPRQALGCHAAEIVFDLLDGAAGPIRQLVACPFVAGHTLAGAPGGQHR
jgi:DNA-binding LacI/PurR family transcriptional regulator